MKESGIMVDAVTYMDNRQFNEHIWRKNTPIKFVDAAGGWDACKKWSPEYLGAALGDNSVWVAHNKQGVFDYNTSSETGAVTKEEVPFHRAVELICEKNADNYYYVQQKPLDGNFGVLTKDIQIPEWIDWSKKLRKLNLWFGGPNCFSPLHYDYSDNFIAQVYGRKRVTLFAPDDTDFLYPNTGKELPHISRVNLLNIDYLKYPLVHRAQVHTVLLNPGDILYIPRHWWHAVYSLDISISLNFWWDVRFRSLVSPFVKALYGLRSG